MAFAVLSLCAPEPVGRTIDFAEAIDSPVLTIKYPYLITRKVFWY